MRTWRVEAKDPRVLADLVARAGGDDRAIADGRVFVNRVRASEAAAPVAPGDIVTIADAAKTAALSADAVTLLHRADDLVAVQKNAGTVTLPDLHGAAQSLLARTARTLGLDVHRLHATSRLDREVSGVVVFALAKSAADRLLRAREEHRYARRYVAIAQLGASVSLEDSGVWRARIGRDGDPKKRKVEGRDAQDATSRFLVIERRGPHALLALAPITGRTHQLRVHAAHAGAPLVGDKMYKGPTRITLPGGRVLSLGRIALHAARVTFPDEAGEDVSVTCPIPADLRDLWGSLGGSALAWDTALDVSMSSGEE